MFLVKLMRLSSYLVSWNDEQQFTYEILHSAGRFCSVSWPNVKASTSNTTPAWISS